MGNLQAVPTPRLRAGAWTPGLHPLLLLLLLQLNLAAACYAYYLRPHCCLPWRAHHWEHLACCHPAAALVAAAALPTLGLSCQARRCREGIGDTKLKSQVQGPPPAQRPAASMHAPVSPTAQQQQATVAPHQACTQMLCCRHHFYATCPVCQRLSAGAGPAKSRDNTVSNTLVEVINLQHNDRYMTLYNLPLLTHCHALTASLTLPQSLATRLCGGRGAPALQVNANGTSS